MAQHSRRIREYCAVQHKVIYWTAQQAWIGMPEDMVIYPCKYFLHWHRAHPTPRRMRTGDVWRLGKP